MVGERRSGGAPFGHHMRTANRARTWACGLLLSGMALVAAWHIVAIAEADRTAASDPSHALRWRPGHPQALLNLSEQHLAGGRIDEAQASARRLLAVEPLEGRGFIILAQAEALRGQHHAAGVLYAIAARRSPRDLRSHAWLVEDFLVTGRYDEALDHIDVILRVAPWQASNILPWLTRLAADPAFAAALARRLHSHPSWRTHLLSMLHSEADPPASDAVFSAMSRLGDLSDREAAEWVAQLIRQGRWSKAYSVWASRLEPRPEKLAMVFNGDFEAPITGSGFDWRRAAVAGVSTELVAAPGTSGRVVHAVFRDRAVAQVDLEQPLLLAPGSYQFSARMRVRILRAETGLEWTLTCDGQAVPIAVSERIAGNFEWREVRMQVTVPQGCLGQWLRLRNPALSGVSQVMSGELWLDDVALQSHSERNGRETDAAPPVPELGARPAGGVVLRVDRGRILVSRGGGFAAVEDLTTLTAGDRVMVLDGALASLDYGEGCRRRLSAVDVHVVVAGCPALSTVADASAPVDAARLAATLDVGKAILQDMAPRPLVPAGR